MIPTQYSKTCNKSLDQQIDIIAQFHTYKIRPLRIAYRTGINIELIEQLISGKAHARVFKSLLAKHRKNRRDQQLNKSLKTKGIAQAVLQEQINQEYVQSTTDKLEATE